MKFNMTKRQNITLTYTSILVPIVAFIEKPHIDFHYKVMMCALISIIGYMDLNAQERSEKRKQKQKNMKDNIGKLDTD